MRLATVNALKDTGRVDLELMIEPDPASEQEMKQVIGRVMARLTGADDGASILVNDDERAVDLAERCGFTKFLYRYEQDGHEVIVDIMDPPRITDIKL